MFSRIPAINIYSSPCSKTIEAYLEGTRGLATKLLCFMADALQVDPDYWMDLFEGGLQDLRINGYPPCPQPDRVMGLANHSDSSAITILLQVIEIAGLQVKKDGKWILIEPLPNAFMVSIGDFSEMITNGTYRSIEDRVIVNSTEERLSVLSLHGMKLGGKVAPAPCLVTTESPPVFRTLSFVHYTERFFQRELDGKSCIDELKLQTEQIPSP
ncbi:SRG1-like protein [Drosera capensis]